MVFLFILIIFILTIFLLPLKVGFTVYTDLSRKTLLLSGFLYGVHIIKVRFYFENGVLLYSLNGRRGKEVNVEKLEKDIKVLNTMNNIKIKDFNVNLRYGALNNPYKTAILIATINEIMKMLYAKTKANNFSYNTLPSFDTQCLTADIKIKVSIILVKLIKDFVKANKEKVYE